MSLSHEYWKHRLTIKIKYRGERRHELSRILSKRLGDAFFLKLGRRPIFVHGDIAMGDLRHIIEILEQEEASFAGEAGFDLSISVKPPFEVEGFKWEKLVRTFGGTPHEAKIAGEVADSDLVASKSP